MAQTTMSGSKAPLPVLQSKRPFLTTAGVEESLITTHGFSLPHLAAWPLLDDTDGRKALRETYIASVKTAIHNQTGIVLETPTWRASNPWFPRLGYSAADVARMNRSAVHVLEEIKHGFETPGSPIIISGCVGPLRDVHAEENTVFFAHESYYDQVHALAGAGVEMLSFVGAVDMNEVKAIVRLAREHSLPVSVTFSLDEDEDEKLLTARRLEEAIVEVDKATQGYVAWYGISCAHPLHAVNALSGLDSNVLKRIGSFRLIARKGSPEGGLSRESSSDLSKTDLGLRALVPNLMVIGDDSDTARSLWRL